MRQKDSGHETILYIHQNGALGEPNTWGSIFFELKMILLVYILVLAGNSNYQKTRFARIAFTDIMGADSNFVIYNNVVERIKMHI